MDTGWLLRIASSLDNMQSQGRPLSSERKTFPRDLQLLSLAQHRVPHRFVRRACGFADVETGYLMQSESDGPRKSLIFKISILNEYTVDIWDVQFCDF